MGGYGSGWPSWRDSKQTVEACSVLSADSLTSEKLLAPGRHQWGTLTWRESHSGRQVGSLGFKLNTLTPGNEHIRLEYTISRTKESLDYPVRLTHVPTPWGTLRWFFVCPLVKDGRACGRRAAKLYLPPGGRYYGCRRCYDLTYKSCQKSHGSDALYRSLARDTGLSFAAVKAMMKE
jgi:hypothetical protein